MQPIPHQSHAPIPGCCHRWRASSRPYIAYCKSIKYIKITSTKNAPWLHRVAVGATGRSPAISAWRTHAHSGVAVTAGELPLAPTLHIVNQRNTQGLHQQKIHYGLHRVAVGATGRSPATPAWCTHAHIPWLLSPRASFHSPLHCILYINKIRRYYINKNTPRLHRVAVGATGRSPAHPHGAPHAHSPGCCHRGRASPRPYIVYCKSTKYAGITSTKIHHGLHRVAVGATGRSPAHPHGAPTRTFRGCCHRGRASTRPYIVCCKSIKYVGITSRSCRGDWEVARHTCNADTQSIP